MRPAAGFAVCSFISNISWQPVNFLHLDTKKGAYLFIADIRDFTPDDFLHFHAVLNKDEKKYAEAFKHSLSKHQYVLAHALLRFLTGKFLKQEQQQIHFDVTKNKKPFIKEPETPVSFNISHAGNKVLLGFNFRGEIGVDIEKIDPAFEFQSFAGVHFSEGEKQMLSGVTKAEAVECFFKSWTRKEAWLKLTGEGITDNLALYDVSSPATGNEGVFITSFAVEEYMASVAVAKDTVMEFMEVKKFPL